MTLREKITLYFIQSTKNKFRRPAAAVADLYTTNVKIEKKRFVKKHETLNTTLVVARQTFWHQRFKAAKWFATGQNLQYSVNYLRVLRGGR